jgi:hypothetical protein
MKIFGNRVLSRIFVPKRNEMIRDRKKLHNNELHNLYSLPDSQNNEGKENEMGKACISQYMHGLLSLKDTCLFMMTVLPVGALTLLHSNYMILLFDFFLK